MPLLINLYENNFRLALWKLTEPLDFFEEKAHLSQNDILLYTKITNEYRKKEWLAVRILLNEVLGFWPTITYMETGKPILNNHSRHLSISHSKEMVGILVCTSPFAGIDIEKTTRNIDHILPRFLSKEEMKNVETSTDSNSKIIHWCAKEAIFKSINEPNIEFSSRIKIEKINTDGTIEANYKSKRKHHEMLLNYMIADEHAIVWTI
jgi:4'-phosphopantetheinyl transferase EntD